MVLFTEKFSISDSLRKKLKKIQQSILTNGPWQIRFDSAFEQVMRACAEPRKEGAGTWITEDIVAGYTSLHAMGYAHSSELWFENELVGGAYGICIGRMFYGESMFARVSDASKIALAYLIRFLESHGVRMIDCQQETAHLASLGAFTIPRKEFLDVLQTSIAEPAIERWTPIAVY